MHALVIPGFLISDEIYKGRTRVVYRGIRERDGVSVIVKTLADSRDGSARSASVRREYEILRDLEVDGVVRAYGLTESGERPALILEDVGGERLKTLIAERRLDLVTCLRLGVQLAAIVAAVHQRNLIHKDINPNNILVDLVTGRLTLIDFSIASRLPVEHQGLSHPSVLEGTIAYMSPEQTGRMNRDIDYRTDFYSLGVTLYEMLTGCLPFDSADPLEVVHAHIAKTPAAPSDLDPSVPRPVSDIVMKLLAKTAEDRYQSAWGLKADLARCVAELEATGRIERMVAGRDDVSDRFVVPQRLYGRERDLTLLLESFERASEGGVELTMVSGYSGIGKTSLIQELYKPIVGRRGYFAAGKFDQIVRVPYGALIQAFRGLVQQLLTESEGELAAWRARLSEAVGTGGGVLAEVIPEIELVLGKQPVPPPLGPAEAQNRFRLVFQNFVGALARKEHPLALFLDDLQWADSATLDLLQSLLTSPDIRFFLLIGAYRDNEVDTVHPLVRTLRALEAEGTRVHHISLGPLGRPDLTLLLRDTLRGELSDVEPLARLVVQKTGGNPFFVTQFLRVLWQEGLLEFDYGANRWIYRMDAIAAAGMTDNVIDLMTRKIQRLSPKAQTALTLGACIGNEFDLSTLAIVSEQSWESAADDLRAALEEGLVLPTARTQGTADGGGGGRDAPTYAFLHDRVQQAAYALIPEERRPAVHLMVGRLLLERWDPATAEEKIFDIVGHLNSGSTLMTDDAERLALAQLDLAAGRRAKASTAYQAALGYLDAGRSLLSSKQWESEYDLMLALHLEALECEQLCGRVEEAERDFARLLERARTRLDKGKVYALRVVQLESMSRYAEAIQLGREALALFGVVFSDTPEEQTAALERELSAIEALVGDRAIESLIDLPVMADPEIRAVMGLLVTLHISGYLLGDKPFTLLNTATMVRLSLTHGNSEESAYAYVLHAMLLGPARGRYREAYEFGVLGLRVNERLPDPKLRARSLMNFAWCVSLWRMPLEASIPVCHETFRIASESGLFTEAAWALFNENWIALLVAGELAAFATVCEANLEAMRRIKMHHIADGGQVILQWARSLQGLTRQPGSLSDATFDEEAYLQAQEGNGLNQMFYFVAKLAVLYTVDDFTRACAVARRSEYIERDFTGNIWDEQRVFYYALSLAATHDTDTPEEQGATAKLDVLSRRLRVWAENSPRNFEAQHLILSAEVARVRGRYVEAMTCYDAAIEAATRHERPRERALANELCAKFWLARGRRRVAGAYMADARDGYAAWGAVAKVQDLERKYPDLVGPRATGSPYLQPDATATPPTAQATTETGVSSLDVASVIKAAQTISGEIDLARLLRKLMRIAIENAGAERGLLFQESEGRLVLAAEGAVGGEGAAVLPPVPLESRPDVSHAIINLVHRTGESVLVGDAERDPRWLADPYVAAARPKSILCVPLANQGKRVGVFYLENNLTSEAFTAERTEMTRILAAQAGISLENARLYREIEDAYGKLAESHALLDTLLVTAPVGLGFLDRELRYVRVNDTLAAVNNRPASDHIGRIPSELIPDLARMVVPLLERVRDTGEPVLDLEMSGPTPGDPERERSWLVSLYPVPGRDGAVLGEGVVVVDVTERKRAEHALRQALTEVEQLKNRLQAENVYLQEEIRTQQGFEDIIGQGAALRKMLRQVEQVAPTDATVLITGETGTGKELLARAIHSLSARRDRPLVTVNCGAISAGLIESELFGHEKGAFTGAVARKIGRFELADRGTIFLDEIGELPLELQVKLLRVLQDGEIERVGGSRPIKVDVRVIAATNRDLEEATDAGRFRSDLFYRLNVFPMHMPPLRERKEDIPLLVRHFVLQYGMKLGKRIEVIPKGVLEDLLAYSWPGNVRELRNVIERALIVTKGTTLELGDWLPKQRSDRAESSVRTLAEVERNQIVEALRQTGWRVSGPAGAARLLGLKPTTLEARMKKLGITRPS